MLVFIVEHRLVVTSTFSSKAMGQRGHKDYLHYVYGKSGIILGVTMDVGLAGIVLVLVS